MMKIYIYYIENILIYLLKKKQISTNASIRKNL